MGRITRIENIINKTINAYSGVKIFPRGLPRFADSLLRGTVRFGKRTGNSIAVLNPDNTFSFATPPQIRDNQVVLSQTTQWLTTGAIVSLGPFKENHKVFDIIDETIILETDLNRSYTTEDRLLIHSYPMVSSIDTATGATSITVKSRYEIANGDVFAYLQSEDLLESLTEIQITKATFLGTTTDPFYTNLYILELAQGIEREIKSQSEVFLRAYPAYFSAAVRVPNALFTADPIGPFLLDILSGKLVGGEEFNDTFAIKTINRSGNFVLGDNTSYVTVERNHVVLERTVNSHTPMFWEIAEGTMRITPNRLVMRVNEKSQFSVGIKCIPSLPVGASWTISLLANEACSIRFFFNPNDFQEFSLSSGVAQSVTVTIPDTGEEVTDIEINILGITELCEVRASDWIPTQDTVEEIQYTFVAEAIGNASYQASGLIIKPYFLGSEFLKSTYDVGENYDGGKVYF